MLLMRVVVVPRQGTLSFLQVLLYTLIYTICIYSMSFFSLQQLTVIFNHTSIYVSVRNIISDVQHVLSELFFLFLLCSLRRWFAQLFCMDQCKNSPIYDYALFGRWDHGVKLNPRAHKLALLGFRFPSVMFFIFLLIIVSRATM